MAKSKSQPSETEVLPQRNVGKSEVSRTQDDSEKHAPRSGVENDKNPLTINVSNSLKKKITAKAQSEGVSIDELVSELIAEGLVLRAWEIMERKTAMRGSSLASSYSNSSNRSQNRHGYRNSNQGNFNSRGRNNHGNQQQSQYKNQAGGGNSSNFNGNQNSQGNSWAPRNNYKNIMEDSANFLEYVRNQERGQK